MTGDVVAVLRWLDTDSPLAIDELRASIVWPDASGVASAVGGFVGDRRLTPDSSASRVRVTECDPDARNADIRSQPERWEAMWERFVDEVRSVGQTSVLVERQVDSPSVVLLGFAGLVVVALGVAGLAASRPGWLACVIAGSVVMAGATAFARRSPEGALLAARWEAFGRSLRGEAVGAAGPPPDLGPQALAYAVALHESDAAAVVLDAHQAGTAGPRWPTQLIDREIETHVNRRRESYLVATSIRGEPSARLRALLSLRPLRRSTSPPPPDSRS